MNLRGRGCRLGRDPAPMLKEANRQQLGTVSTTPGDPSRRRETPGDAGSQGLLSVCDTRAVRGPCSSLLTTRPSRGSGARVHPRPAGVSAQRGQARAWPGRRRGRSTCSTASSPRAAPGPPQVLSLMARASDVASSPLPRAWCAGASAEPAWSPLHRSGKLRGPREPLSMTW